MSEDRTHLRESVEALRDAAQRVAEALDETAGSGAGVSSAVLDPTGSSVGELSDAAPSPAPSSPAPEVARDEGASPPDARRWCVNRYSSQFGLALFVYESEVGADEKADKTDPDFERVEVVPAAALDALREELDQMQAAGKTMVAYNTERYNQNVEDAKTIADLRKQLAAAIRERDEAQERSRGYQFERDAAIRDRDNCYTREQVKDLVAEARRLRRAYDAACAYISVNVCDNDTTAEMWRAWEVFAAERRALEGK